MFAVDGTELELTRYVELSKEFPPTRHTTAPRARISVLCDVINNCLIHADIRSLAVLERTMARNHIEYYKNKKTINCRELLIFDRGYPSKELVHVLRRITLSF